jgi:hypothetical protein
MVISVENTSFHVLDLERRMPFHFGNVEVTHDPQVFLQITADVDGTERTGVSMGGLIPGWFYKDPSMSPEAGFRAMIEAFRSAADIAEDVKSYPTPFSFWSAVYDRQEAWAETTEHPPLLWSYGVSMVEQAVIDAFCRANDLTFSRAVRENHLGIDLGEIYEELAGTEPADHLPADPRQETAIRHTVGQTDPLTDDDLDAGERLDDGLPQSLAEYVREDGVDHFKIKLSGDREQDATRLGDIQDLLEDLGVDDYLCTVDANEGYPSAREFQRQWEAHRSDSDLEALLERVRYVEQPLTRDDAFTEETREVFTGWDDAPPIVIDESDGRIDNAGRALEYGYAGTSHKNCKGVFKGIVNACLIAHRNDREDGREYAISAEDLTTVGPIELQADFAVTATIGADHVERNGHHYFRGLSAFPEDVQETALAAHGDLYRRHEAGFVALDIDDGTVDLTSTVSAPFGVEPLYDGDTFTPLEEWLNAMTP